MAVGQGALIGGDSYLAVARESTFGTGVTATAVLEFMSASLKMTKEFKPIEQIESSRVNSKGLSLSRKVEGDIEFYYSPLNLSSNYLLQNAFGGTVTSATATGETIGGLGFTHTFNIGSMDQAYPSLSINMRKGGSSGGKIFQYSGLRVDELTFSAEIDDGLMCKAALIGKDVTTGADVSTFLTATTSPILSFVDGRLSIEGVLASLTSSSFWHIQKFELSLKNNLNGDTESRRIGSDTLVVLPPGMAEISLKATIRFDTTTAYAAMLAATQFSAQVEMLGPTMTGSQIRQGIRFDMPVVYIDDAGDPEVSDASGILTSEVSFKVLRDNTSATGYALKALVTTLTNSMA